MSSWITATGTPQQSTSNLQHEEQRGHARHEVGGTSIEVHTSFDGGESKLVTTKNAEYTAGEDLGYQGSVIATAKQAHGGPIVNRSVSPNDVVTLPDGTTTNVAAAVHAGLLTRNSDGSFSDVVTPEALKNPADGHAMPTPEGDPLESPNDASEAFHIGDEGETGMDEVVKGALPGDQIKAMDEVLQFGEVSENTLSRMASAMGLETEQMADKINTIHQGFYDAATDHLASHGVTNEDAFEAFIGDNPRLAGRVAEGARALVMSNDPSSLTEVASTFIEQADRYMPEDVKAALDEVGFTYSAEDGRIIVNIESFPVPWTVAVRQGLIKFL